MKRRLLTLTAVAILILTVVTPVQPAGAQEGGRPGADRPGQPAPGRLLVFTDGNPGAAAAVRGRAQQRGGTVVDEVRVQPNLTLQVVNARAAAMADFAGIPGVREVAPDVPPSPTDEVKDWGVDKIEADLVWPPAIGGVTGAGVVVAVVDGGVQLSHSDLQQNLAGPHANCSGDGECRPGGNDDDGDGHGTGVAGIVAAADNETGTIGVSHRATILAVNCFEPGTFFSCLRGVYYAAGRDSNGTRAVPTPRAKVVNMSWGWEKNLERQCRSCITTIRTVMDTAWGDGLILVSSAGNSGTTGGNNDTVGYPARLSNVIAVAATNQNNVRAWWSSTGSTLDLSAPGVSIRSTWTGGYTTWNGTSAASPHVAGVAALVWEKYPSLTNSGVRSRLESTAQSIGSTSQYGKGLVRADLAVQAAQ